MSLSGRAGMPGPDGPPAADGRTTLRDGDWATLRADAARVRLDVFVAEQGIPEALEWDEHDAVSVHAVVYDRDRPVATGRLLPDGRIGRMAVLRAWRGRGLGGAVLEHLVGLASARGDAVVELSAQVHAIGFYRRHGFDADGPVYDDAGIPHRTMRRMPGAGRGD